MQHHSLVTAKTMVVRLILPLILSTLFVCFPVRNEAHDRQESPPPDHMITVRHSAQLTSIFRRFQYDLAPIRHGDSPVVPLFFSSFPADFGQIKSIAQRKEDFIRILLPLILNQNFQILCDRTKLLRLRMQWINGKTFDADDVAWIHDLLQRYTIADADGLPSDMPSKLELLVRRVDRVPVPMVLAQAIEESGWGTSRFVRLGNAIFGQRTYRLPEDGIVPHGIKTSSPDASADFKIRSFPNLLGSVASYMHNLNTYRLYQDFRDRRAALEKTHSILESKTLVDTLTFYSERRGAYIKALHAIIDFNHLEDFRTVSFPPAALHCG